MKGGGVEVELSGGGGREIVWKTKSALVKRHSTLDLGSHARVAAFVVASRESWRLPSVTRQPPRCDGPAKKRGCRALNPTSGAFGFALVALCARGCTLLLLRPVNGVAVKQPKRTGGKLAPYGCPCPHGTGSFLPLPEASLQG